MIISFKDKLKTIIIFTIVVPSVINMMITVVNTIIQILSYYDEDDT